LSSTLFGRCSKKNTCLRKSTRRLGHNEELPEKLLGSFFVPATLDEDYAGDEGNLPPNVSFSTPKFSRREGVDVMVCILLHVILTIQAGFQAFHKKFYESILTEMKKIASTKELIDLLEQMRYYSICVLPTSPGKKKM
jgi:hypothetical protein